MGPLDEKCSALTRTLIFCILVPLFFCINSFCFSTECNLSKSSLLPSIFFLILWLIHFLSLTSVKSIKESYQRSIKKVSKKYWIMSAITMISSTPKTDNKDETSFVPNKVSMTIEPENKSSANHLLHLSLDCSTTCSICSTSRSDCSTCWSSFCHSKLRVSHRHHCYDTLVRGIYCTDVTRIDRIRNGLLQSWNNWACLPVHRNTSGCFSSRYMGTWRYVI